LGVRHCFMTKVLRAAAAADIVESFMRGCNC
jgi:hypothetical protein